MFMQCSNHKTSVKWALMTDNMVVFYLMTAFVGLLIGVAKGGLGGLIGTLATPLMALVMPPNQVVGLLLPMLMIADVFAVATYWKRWRTRLVFLLLPGGVAGVTIGTFFIKSASTELWRNVLAAIVLVFALYKLLENFILRRLTYKGRDWHGLLAGVVAGFSSTLAHAGGPPVAIYLLLQKVSPIEFNASTVLFFAILNWVKVPYYAYAKLFDFDRLIHILWLLPVIPLGVALGRWMTSKIDRVWFERLIVILLLVSGFALLLE
jgi:uncharacterized membrane protein YfcA